MAKKNLGNGSNAKGKQRAPKPDISEAAFKRTLVAAPKGTPIDWPALAHARMLLDPCGADLVPTVYPGDRGYINRFVRNAGISIGGTDTSFIYIVKPGNALGSQTGNALSSGNQTIAFGNGNFPGNNFFSTNAAKQRCAAFCTTIRPTASPNNATGTLHFGIVSAAALPNGAILTADVAATYCTESVSCSQALMAPLEVRWVPGSFDDRYCPQGVTDDDSDRNVLIVVGVGFPAGVGFQIRETAIVEWSPKTNLGVTIDATSVKPSVCDKDCVVKYLNTRNKDWWWNLGKKALNITRGAVTGYFSGGVVGALGTAIKYM